MYRVLGSSGISVTGTAARNAPALAMNLCDCFRDDFSKQPAISPVKAIWMCGVRKLLYRKSIGRVSVPNSSSTSKTNRPRPRYTAECHQDMEQEVYLNWGTSIAMLRFQGSAKRWVLMSKQFHKTAPCPQTTCPFTSHWSIDGYQVELLSWLYPTRTTHSLPFPVRYTCETIWAYKDSRYRSDPHWNLFTWPAIYPHVEYSE